ncbi:CDP-glycerol:glycerophosphate glycerophosphotransferase [Erysipelotrichaceae bacterium OttesenSCG-928-M19]|nr:CDP-glycerol:glycerophosphate glycerophosphotransferase [Erysipelotrichaceae bacterium OttesenSCG-928-M19]
MKGDTMSQIAIIIPTYNSQAYLISCLESINRQTYQGKINLYLIDDCSTDNTVEIINNFQFRPHIKLSLMINQENMTQGYSRNTILKDIIEPYVVFLDSDDYLDERFLEIMLEKCQSTNSDIVFSDWIFYHDEFQQYDFKKSDSLLHIEKLEGNDCANLLALNIYFSTPAIYKTTFLKDHKILYGEGYWYEDFEFIVNCAMHAQKITFYHYPLYIVRSHDVSTTKQNYDGAKHLYSLEKAVLASLNYLYDRSEYAIYYFYRYIILRTLLYTRTRAPLRFRYQCIKRINQLLNRNQNYSLPDKNSTLLNYIFNQGILKNNQYLKIIYKDWRIRMGKKRRLAFNEIKMKLGSRRVKPHKILFVGFDDEFKGNSKYLFNLMRNKKYDITFLPNYKKNSIAYYAQLNSAKLIIFETWSGFSYQKKDNQVYLQLWHGSPLKKMAFSSLERYVMEKNRFSKARRFNDYQQWDYLLIDNEGDDYYFNDCFIYNNFKILPYGYPRVKWLIHNNNEQVKSLLKKKYHITKPLILYVPTWRDSQLINDDTSFLLNIKTLQAKYPQYQFLSVEHSYLSNITYNHDIQELLLICDLVISDYSSIIFDALKINKKILLYQPDLEEYRSYRGLYEDRFVAFKDIICYNGEEIVDNITNYENIPIIDVDNYIDYDEFEDRFMNLLKEIGLIYE